MATTPAISSPGIGSGLDVTSIVSKLMAVESQPMQLLQKKQSDYQTQLSAVGTIKSALSTFESAMADLSTPDSFKLFTATSSDPTVFDATATSSAAVGNYSVQVNQLAAAEKMGSSAFADAGTTVVGNAGDQMKITVNGNTFTVDLGQTLNQIRDQINSATDNAGVTASVIQENSTSNYLTLSSNSTGTANSISLSFVDSGGNAIADPLSMTTTQPAADAQVVIDNTYTLTRSSNTITDGITGITLNLNKADTSTAYTLNVSQDVSGVTNKAQAFVDAYNALHKAISDAESGTLQGDNTILSIDNQIRDVMNTVPTGLSSQYSYLADVGVAFQKDGTLALDSTAFQTALQADPNGVAQLFGNNDQGYGYRLQALADTLLQTGGLVDTHTQGIDDRISSLQNQIDDWNTRLANIKARYMQQFTALDTLVGSLQTTSSYLTQQLASLKSG